MTPLVRCYIMTVDEDFQPVAGVRVMSSPKVGWWNYSSQIYCHHLVRGERLLRERNWLNCVDEAFPQPFQGERDGDGRVTLKLPVGKKLRFLEIDSVVYELPVLMGHRLVRNELSAGETSSETLLLQPCGTEKLGEWGISLPGLSSAARLAKADGCSLCPACEKR